MTNKIIGVVFLLFALVCGVVFFSGAFMHGRWRPKSDDVVWGVGLGVALVASAIAFLSGRRRA